MSIFFGAYDGDKLLAFGSELFKYDALGNPTKYLGKACEWSNGRQLVGFDGNTFTYDGQGRRIEKNGIAFTYDSAGKLIRQTDGTNTLSFLYDHEGVVGVEYNDSTYFYRRNVQGDITSLLDSNGSVVIKYTYDAWGDHDVEVLDSTCTVLSKLNPYRYRGYYYDTETKLYFLKTRYYDPVVGRFITIDDLQYLDPQTINGLNLYAYCGNNPVMNVDENGTKWLKNFFKIVAAVVVVAAVAAVTALTMGVAAVAIAGAAGATLSTVAAVGVAVATTAFACGFVVGGLEIISQCVNEGVDNLNILSVGIKTFGAAVDGGMIAASAFTGPLGQMALGLGRIGVAGMTSAAYGISKRYKKEDLRDYIIQGMAFAALASIVPFVHSNQATAGQLSALIKAGIATFNIIKKPLTPWLESIWARIKIGAKSLWDGFKSGFAHN